MNTRHASRWALVFSLAAIAACSQSHDAANDDYAEGVAELSAVQLSATDDTPSEGLATGSDEVSAAAIESLDAAMESVDGLDDPAIAQDLRSVRAGVRALNQALRSALQPVAALIRAEAPDLEPGDTAVWTGIRGALEYRLFVKRGVAKRYGWLLRARPAGSTAEFATVGAGQIAVGTAARRGVGSLGIDLDALGAMDPSIVARGKLLNSFHHGPRGTTLAYALSGFTPDIGAKKPFDAIYRGVHLDGLNRIRLAYHGDVAGSATAQEELILARVRHLKGIGGRMDAIAVQGDVPAGEALVVTACWSAGLAETYRLVAQCPLDGVGGERCKVVGSSGDPNACALVLRVPELPPTDPTAPMADGDDPNADLVPPTVMPDGSAG